MFPFDLYSFAQSVNKVQADEDGDGRIPLI